VDDRLDRHDRGFHRQRHIGANDKASSRGGARRERFVSRSCQSRGRNVHRGNALPAKNKLPKIRHPAGWPQGAHSLEAFIYDKPLLAWTVQQGFGSSIELIDTTFDPQEYAFAVPSNSPLERTINVAILEAVHSDWWEQTTFRYLGSR
jgi:hypothetical protein